MGYPDKFRKELSWGTPHEQVYAIHWEIKGFERNRKQNHRKPNGFAKMFDEAPPRKHIGNSQED